ncbi:MAG: ATP-binding protein, partial [Verrucomicrobiota bacterium]|nr:ATP-binding protein [Verrucomicrobiota bacterium]
MNFPFRHATSPGRSRFERVEYRCLVETTLYFFALVCFCFCPFSVAAETSATSPTTGKTPSYRKRLWQSEEGLPQNSVQALAQTHDGYLWVGTQNGLARFDGIRFTVFDSRTTPEIRNSFIYALCATKDGSLWIGTFTGGLVRLKKGIFSLFTRSDGLPDDAIRSLFESSDGSLWIGTTNGLSRFQQEKFRNFSKREGLADNVIRSIGEDQNGNLWIGTDLGVNQIVGGKIMRLPEMNDGLPTFSVKNIYPDKKGNLWFGTVGGLLRMTDGKVSTFTQSDSLADNLVNTLCEDQTGNLWVGTAGGLSRFTGGQWVTEKNEDGTPFDVVSSLLEDHEGNVWIGAKDGLTRLNLKSFTTFTQQHGLTHNNVMSVCESRKGGLWVGTWGGGVNRLIDGHAFPYPMLTHLPSDLILALHEDRRGNLWVGTDFDGGIFQLNEENITSLPLEQGVEDRAIRVIHEDRHGNLWFGTSSSLLLWKNEKLFRFTTAEGLSGNTVRAILEDHEGNLWIGTSGGLSRLKNGKFTNFTTQDGLSKNVVISLHEDEAHQLWIGTSGGGLNRMFPAPSKPRFTAYTSREGLFDNEILEILEDDFDNLWMSCLKGIFRVSKKDLEDFDAGKRKIFTCVVYGKADGMSSVQCNGVSKPAGWKSKDGRLWFPTTRGVVVVDPRSIRKNDSPPLIVIEEVISDKSHVLRLESKVSRLSATQDFVLKPGRGELEIHYTALSFCAPEKNRFKYRLEGYDRDWVDAQTRRVAYYNNLSPGNYSFQVKACNNDGVWNETGSTIKLTLQPHYWQTWWFFSLCGMGFVGFVGGSARYITKKRMQRKLELLEQQHAIEKERTRIAQDMHDDLGARLTEILMLSNLTASGRGGEGKMKLHSVKVVAAAEDLVRNLDGIVWAVNPQNDSLDQLVLYFYEYVQRFLGATNIRYRWEVPQNLPSISLTAEVRHSLFLVLKEALNNVVKHAEATEVSIHLSFANSLLTISIEDNGKGFSEETMQISGNGLLNMKKRITTIGGQFEMESAPNRGT